jgi:hypothetical protein
MSIQRFCVLLLMLASVPASAEAPSPRRTDAMTALEQELTAKYGEAERPGIVRGIAQVARFWRLDDSAAAGPDGDSTAFASFVRDNYAGDAAARDALFERLEFVFESIDGHLHEIGRDLRRQSDLDLGPIQSFDETLAAYDPGAHLSDDLFANKLAFVVLLNFPLTSLEQRLTEGGTWTRRQWAEARLAERFGKRIPAAVNLATAKANSDAAQYIAGYNIWMHHVVDSNGTRLFPPRLRLLSHWNLRDEIKADYGDARNGLAKQRTIVKIMERIVTQTIPDAVVDNPQLDWNPASNEVHATTDRDSDAPPPPGKRPPNQAEPDTRYAKLLAVFRAQRQVDAWSPTAPTLIARRFDENRQIPEARVRKMLEDVLTSPEAARVAKLVEARLGRKLEPFDIWYDGFRARGEYSEAELDAMVRKRYPTAQAYQDDIPRMLKELGFSPERAATVAANIVVDPARGSGHAMGAARRGDKAHLRTRLETDGMNYKGFNIAVHEMGHNVEQTFSLNMIDHTLLQGVPNTAFTEALAFVFQAHDLELLGLAKPNAETRAMQTLNAFWSCYEISGVAMVDMEVWHWMYAHPEASPAELKAATVAIAKDVWNRYYAGVFGTRDVVLLGVYSHMIDSMLYLPDYPVGYLIAFQIEQQMEKAGAIGPEFERMAVAGNIAPDLWMEKATGAPVGAEALLAATRKAMQAR